MGFLQQRTVQTFRQGFEPAEALKQLAHNPVRRGCEGQLFAADWMLHGQLAGVQQQTWGIKMLAELTAVAAFAVARIANDGMGEVFQVTADLMFTPGVRRTFQ